MSVRARHLALLVCPVLLLTWCGGDDERTTATRSRPGRQPVTTTSKTTSEVDSCAEGSSQSGDVDGDGRPDAVTLEPGKGPWEGIVRVRLATGTVHEVTLRSTCPGLLGLADVNGDEREELWWKDGLGNTAHLFNLVTWLDDRLVVVVEPGTENPLLVGWGFSGGATLWCADANGDGRTDIIQQVFARDSQGQIEDEREVVYELHRGTLVRVSEGPARTPPPGDSEKTLTCGAVTW